MDLTRLALLVAGLVLGLTGWALGALPLSSAEPDGIFVDCGPAIFGRPSPLPDPACGSAYQPLPVLSLALLTAGLVVVVMAVSYRKRTRERVPTP